MGEIEIDIDELVNKIANASYSYLNYKGERDSNKIVRGGVAEEASQKSTIYSVVAKWINENVVPLQSEISSLKAKLYVYEAVIANSNFKASIVKEKKEIDEEQLIAWMNSINANMGAIRLDLGELNGALNQHIALSLTDQAADVEHDKNR